MRKDNMLESFGDNLNVAVFGASGGIGSALLTALEEAPNVRRIFALSRSETENGPSARVTRLYADVEDEASLAKCAAVLKEEGPLHLVIVATGILHGKAFRPEKSWRQIEPEAMAKLFAVNTIGSALIAKHTLPLLARDGKASFAALSARVGSISDNSTGGWHAYRASKAALNMLIRNFALELALKHKGAVALALHPGTVDTELSQPFQARLPEKQITPPEQAAFNLLSVIDAKGPEDSGGFFAWDGTPIAP